MLYHAYQAYANALAPLQHFAELTDNLLTRRMDGEGHPADRYPEAEANASPWAAGYDWSVRLAAACEVTSRLRLTHSRPAFDIPVVNVNGRGYEVVEEVVHRTPFATLLRFHKIGAPEQPRVLLAAPLSGHFATLLRDTVRVLATDHDVYITDWHNARDVPVSEGRFGLDEYVDHLITFLRCMGPGAHVVAICQPCVAAVVAVAALAQDNDPIQPATMTLMAGPIDCRINPTDVNRMANEHPIDWFESKLISRVPLPNAGAMRRVYPGVLQLTAFMSMNPARHRKAFKDLYEHRIAGEHDKADAIARFYAEYFAVNDLTAEFYLETVERVFQRYDLPKGVMRYKDTRIQPSAIRRTALLTVEGERDDICSIGQTVAAQDLCTSIHPYLRTHHVQTGVGHYGVFSGRKWSQSIYPRVREMIHLNTA